MRIVATSDTHHKVDVNFVPDGEVLLHCGDLMQNGYPSEWPDCLDWLNELPHKIKIITFGNHDFHPFLYPGPSLQDLRKIGVTVLGYPGNKHYYTMKLPNGMIVGASPYVHNLPRWAFNASKQTVEEHLKAIGRVDILMTHSPPYGVLDKVLDGRSVGILAYYEYILLNNPILGFSGHIHESYGYTKVVNTHCYNVAMCDRSYKHVNPPVVIDVNTLC